MRAVGDPLSRSTSRRTASSPIVWIDWSIVVNGGSVSADSGMLSKPITDTSSGTDRPREWATFIVWIAERSFAAKIAVGGSASSSNWRAGSREVSSSYPPTRRGWGSASMPAVARASW